MPEQSLRENRYNAHHLVLGIKKHYRPRTNRI
jgi:hypothetical protein